MIPINCLISLKYEGLICGKDFGLIDRSDGNGIQIEYWNCSSIERPSLDDLNNWQKDPVLKAKYQALLNIEHNKPILKALNEIDFKSIRALRENDVEFIAQYTQVANVLRSQLLPTDFSEL